jgi:hypothetical protein
MKRPQKQRQLPQLHDVLLPQGLIRRKEIANLANRLLMGSVGYLGARVAQEGSVAAVRNI